MRYRMDRATSSSPPSHADTFDHFSSRNVRLPTWMSDMNAARTCSFVPWNGRAVGMSGRTRDCAMTSPRSFAVPTTPTTSSITTDSAAAAGRFALPPERGGQGYLGGHDGLDRERPGPRRRLAGDRPRIDDVVQRDDERHLGALLEERSERRDGVLLAKEEVDRVRL